MEKRRKGFRCCSVCKEAEEYWCRALFNGIVINNFPSVLKSLNTAKEAGYSRVTIQDGYSCHKCQYRYMIREFTKRLDVW